MASSPPKKNTAYTFYVGLLDQADTKLLKASPTIAAGDFKVSTDGGAFANPATLPAVTPAGGRAVLVTLSAAEMNGDKITVVASDAAGAEWCDLLVSFDTSVRQVDDLAYPATSGRSIVVDAAGLVDANVVKVGPTGAGTAQTAGDIVGDTNDIQARLPASLVGGRIDASVGAIAAGAITAASLAADAGDEIADAVLDRDMSAGTDSGSATVRTVRQALRFLRNFWSISGGTLTVKKEDDTTTSWTAAVTQTAGNPVSKIDPA